MFKGKKSHAFFEPLTLITFFLLTSCYLASVVGKNIHIPRYFSWSKDFKIQERVTVLILIFLS